jgi:hypothetical protein
MGDKFLGGNSSNLTNGTANLYIANLTIDGLDPSLPVKTNAVKTLTSEKLAISDVEGLQTQLDTKLTNPLSQNLNLQDFDIVDGNAVEFNKKAGQANATVGTLKLYANTDGEFHKVDELGNDTVIAGGNPFDQSLNTNDNVVFNQMTVDSTFGTYRVSSNEQEWRCFGTIDPRWEIRRARGTPIAPQDIQAGDKIKDELAFSQGGGASEIVYESLVSATENHTATAKGVKLEISTCNNGTDIPTDKIILDSQGVNIREGLRLGDVGTDITFPITRGTNGQILKSDASGVLSFQNESGVYDQSLNTTDDVEFDELKCRVLTQSNVVSTFSIQSTGSGTRLDDAGNFGPTSLDLGTGGFATVPHLRLNTLGSTFNTSLIMNSGNFTHFGDSVFYGQFRNLPTQTNRIEMNTSGGAIEGLILQQKASTPNLTISGSISGDIAVLDVASKSLSIVGGITIGGVGTEYTLPNVRGANGQILKTDGVGNVSWQNESVGSTTLSGLTDVNLSGLAPDNVLQYNLGLNQWFNTPPSTLFGQSLTITDNPTFNSVRVSKAPNPANNALYFSNVGVGLNGDSANVNIAVANTNRVSCGLTSTRLSNASIVFGNAPNSYTFPSSRPLVNYILADSGTGTGNVTWRDVQSLLPSKAYGQQYWVGNASPTLIGALQQGVYVNITGVRVAGELAQFSSNALDMTYTGIEPRVFKLEYNGEWEANGAASNTYQIGFHKNGVLITSGQMRGKLDNTNANYPRNVSTSTLVSVVQNDTLSIRIRNLDSTQGVLIQDMSFIICEA